MMRLGLTDSIMGLVLKSPLCAEESVRLLEFRFQNLPKSIEFSIRPTPQICIAPESGLIQPSEMMLDFFQVPWELSCNLSIQAIVTLMSAC